MSHPRIVAFLLIVSSLVGCTRAPIQTPPALTPTQQRPAPQPMVPPFTPTLAGPVSPPPSHTPAPVIATPRSSPTSELAAYQFPASIDPAKRYMIYLHGRIVEEQGLHAVSPEFGPYEYVAILKTLASHGFIVISEQRPKNADGEEYARRTADQVTRLLEAGVPPGNITVVGASKGAAIATKASCLLENERVNFVLLGTCNPATIEEWKQNRTYLHGNVLSIYDSADTQFAGSCASFFDFSTGHGLARHDEIVLHIGTGHGILYQPLDAWVLPTVQWANQ